ncbi:unnamed protein product, partial [Symbiodinium microadriaticum]
KAARRARACARHYRASLERPRRRPSTRDRRDPRSRTTARPRLLYGWMAPQRERYAGGVRRTARGLGRGEASQRRRRRTPGELSCPCASASGVGQGVLPGRFLPSPLEHPRGQAGRGPIQSAAPHSCLPELCNRRQRLPERVVQPGRAAAGDAAHAGGLPGRGRTDPRPGRRAAELPPGHSYQVHKRSPSETEPRMTAQRGTRTNLIES